jgi:hypothetical protein
MVCLGRGDFELALTDNCPGAIEWHFSECRSDQPEDDLGDGHFEPDCVLQPDGSICFRSERQGTVPAGRHYGVLAVAVDACGNESAPTLVGDAHPHDQSPRGIASTRPRSASRTAVRAGSAPGHQAHPRSEAAMLFMKGPTDQVAR